MDSLRFYHKYESRSISNVANIADDVVEVLEDSPRPGTSKVAITLWDTRGFFEFKGHLNEGSSHNLEQH